MEGEREGGGSGQRRVRAERCQGDTLPSLLLVLPSGQGAPDWSPPAPEWDGEAAASDIQTEVPEVQMGDLHPKDGWNPQPGA